MGKYSKELIRSYINGDDIVDYDIDALENDYIFMIEAIKLSHDKNMYNLCSDEVKNNHNFVIALINEFKGDDNFIFKVVSDYLEDKDSDGIEYQEILAIVGKMYANNRDIESPVFPLLITCQFQYNMNMSAIKNRINEKDKEE